MTIAATAIKVESTGDGATLDFTFTFQIYATSDIKVYKVVIATGVMTLQTLGADYTVDILDTGPGGTVTYAVAPTALQNSFIILDIPAAQSTSLTTNGKFRDDQVEDMADRLTLLVQQAEEAIARCLKVAVDQSNPPDLPELGTTAGYLYWDGISAFELKP